MIEGNLFLNLSVIGSHEVFHSWVLLTNKRKCYCIYLHIFRVSFGDSANELMGIFYTRQNILNKI